MFPGSAYDAGMDETERLTKGELALCAVMILAGIGIAAVAIHLLVLDRRAAAVTGEAETIAKKAASERLGG